jgi:hypothetical protein
LNDSGLDEVHVIESRRSGYAAVDKIKLYRSLFRGRDDALARRWDKNGSYFPDYTFDWNEFNVHKASEVQDIYRFLMRIFTD